MDNLQIVSLAVNVMLGLVAFFGGMTIKGLSDAIHDLRNEDNKLRDRMDDFVKVDVLEIWRKEQRDDTKLIFSKLEEIQRGMSTKMSREECSVCRKDCQK
jgi:hypothetical protein